MATARALAPAERTAADEPAAERTSKGERTRRRLLEAAEGVFGEQGFHPASVTAITRRAGVANGTFYLYFPSKTDILVELVRTRGHEMRGELHRATAGLETRAEIERAGLAAFLEWVRRHPNIYRVVRNAEFVDQDVFREWYRKLGEAYKRALVRAMDRGEIERADPETLAYCLMAIGDFTGMRWVLWRNGAKVPDDVFESVMAFALRGLGISDGRPRSRPRPGAAR